MARNAEFTADQLTVIDQMQRDGASVKDIATATQLSPAQITWYLSESEKLNGKVRINEQGQIEHVRRTKSDILNCTYDIIWLNLQKLYKQACDEDAKALGPAMLNQLASMVTQIDKIMRLDAGTATEIFNYQILKLEEIRQFIETNTPAHIVLDAKMEVEKLKQVDWDAV